MIKLLQPGKYLVRVARQDRRTGLHRDKRKICNGTKREAEELERKLLDELESGDRPRRLTLTAYAQQWLELRAHSLKPSTLAKYVNDMEKHILPALGDFWIDSLRPSDISKFVADDLKEHAPTSVANRLRLLRTIGQDALAEEVTDRYFCARVKAPRVTGYDDDAPNLLSGEELRCLMAKIPAQWRALFCTLSWTGQRWGEVSGLKWDDVDLEAQVIKIRRSNWKGEMVEPKTTKSKRTVPVPDELAEILRWHRRRQIEDQAPGLTAGWVFPTEKGTPHRGTPLNAVLKRAMVKAGLDVRFTVHGLRRSFNDLARRVAAGQVVRAIVGHTTEAMTEHYSRVDDSEKLEAASNVVELILGTNDGTPGGDNSGGAQEQSRNV